MHIPIWAFVLWTLAWGTIGVGVAALVSATRLKVAWCKAAEQEKLADYWRCNALRSDRALIVVAHECEGLRFRLVDLEAALGHEPSEAEVAEVLAAAPATMEATGGG